ncbi:NAD-dependent epimerase/dehydratase family protein [Bacillus sp. FJAT-22090]|uniref:NAD-dependent epimerase/dehydratase family protein n=1 Tax=Bacillus sp. FJAT-22090 TaxID=1581038 RepID=UPI0011A3428D|nr:NAD-dependent epimerase/dehydratase family protein [Bacillus sp. FJAT-22090]
MASKARLLITGATGFTGVHACKYFKKAGYEVIAVTRSYPSSVSDDRIHMEQCNLTDKQQVKSLIQKTKPDKVIHLAGKNHVQESWSSPITSFEANVLSTAFLIETIRQENPLCKILIVGSALQFDLGDISTLQNPYSLSKTMQVLIAQSWKALYGMDILIAKPSNLIGPGPSNGICSILAKKTAEMELHGTERILTVNNLFAKRDFIDVRDAVRAYAKILDVGESGKTYEVCSGKPRYLKEITDSLQALSIVNIEIQTLTNEVEKLDVATHSLLGNLGWSPSISFEKSIEDILNYQRKILL